MIRSTFAGAAMAVVLTLSGNAVTAQQQADADTVLATVGGVPITLGHMIAAVQSLPEQFRDLPDADLYQGLLTQLIQQNALAQTLPDDLDRATQLGLDNQMSGYLASAALEAAIAEQVTEASLRAFYAEQVAGFEGGTEWNASHLLVATEEEAAALKEQADAGADFAELARENSTGPSGPNGGALGWFGEGMMVPPFEAAVKELSVGEVSGPVQTQFGWHLVKLNETRVASAPPFEAVAGELREALTREVTAQVVDDATAAVEVERSEIEIDPALIRNGALLED